MPYQPLDANQEEIRLCFLHPSTEETEAVECDIYNIPLPQAAGKYTALSYVWGDPTLTEAIRINGIEWQVTKNLASALRSIRRRGVGVWSDTVWV
ncbi:hypothetical protein AOQ84DRAFT_289022 [Glonium stellatum]|uniref:Heterokaryon incompatibility domain-containing protein n=1 Tax=Glonium stellatum TaxID=574774 RepID=A0A8E2JVD3_9PEZI|nr:hypothetical protein AOQ84DRAFT_289022 [Glonium stellatum]